MARSERFELPTLGFEVRCSIQLSYERVRGVDYQTWPDRASSLLPGRPGRRAGLWRRRSAKNLFLNIRCPQVRQCPLPSKSRRNFRTSSMLFLQLVIVAEFGGGSRRRMRAATRDRSEAGMPAAVLAEIGRSTLPAGIGRRAIVIGERAGLRSGPVIVAEADRVGQPIG